jgi:probable F420-dependent oxidoreductase
MTAVPQQRWSLGTIFIPPSDPRSFEASTGWSGPVRLHESLQAWHPVEDLGLGSGWNKPEYELLELSYDRPALRAARLRDAVAAMNSAWAGETLLAGGPDADSTRAVPKPVQRPHPPLLIGGHGDTVLGLAADEADITGLTWTGASLAPTGASTDALAERVTFVRDRAGARVGDLELNILTQGTSIGGDAEATLAGLASALGVEKELVRDSPLTLIGSVSEVVDKLVANRERLGISYVVVFDTAIDDMTPVVQRLART